MRGTQLVLAQLSTCSHQLFGELFLEHTWPGCPCLASEQCGDSVGLGFGCWLRTAAGFSEGSQGSWA